MKKSTSVAKSKVKPVTPTPSKKPVNAPVSEKPPLYAPKSPVQLPPRKKTNNQRWPIINLPPLKRKPWDWTKVRQCPAPKPKVVVEIPPLKRKPWAPTVTTTPIPKPKIEYPPLKMRTKKEKPIKPRPKLVRYEKTQYPIKPSTLEKVWNHFKCRSDKLQILRGSFSVNHKRFNELSMRLTSASSDLCLVYSHLVPMSKWTTKDVDKILELGATLYKESLYGTKLVKGTKELRPDQINSIIYVDLQKASVNIGKTFQTICLSSDPMKDVENGLKEMLTTSKQCILNYGNKNYAIWEDKGAHYMFIPEDVDEEGALVKSNYGQSSVVRLTDFTTFIDYLKEVLKHTPDVIVCRLYSFELLKVTQMQQHPDKSLLEALLDVKARETKRALKKLAPTKKPSGESIQLKPKDEGTFQDKLTKHLVQVTLTKDYTKLSDTHGILRSMFYNSSTSKTSTLVLACILVLNKHRATTWTRQTLHEIFSLGDSILQDNEIPESSTDVSISDLKVVRFDKQTYSVNTENVIFGQIESSSLNVTDLTDGVKEFLINCDIGVINGPQVIPFWQESGLYFMFDPKERDVEGRKYQQEKISDARHGSSCVLWFKCLEDLVRMYKSNVPQKHMRDLFKITRVEAKPCLSNVQDWHSWKMIASDKWILRGTFDETDDRFEKENRGQQGVCMAATAIAYTKLINVSKWTTKVIDKILKVGDGFYKIVLVKLKSSKKFVSPLLTVDEFDKQMKIQDELVHFNIGKSMINGSLLAQEDEKSATLSHALTKFFENSNAGILIACLTAVAVFKDEDCYYVFDPHPRDEEGGNLDTKVIKKSFKGLACALRFTSIESLTNALLNNFKIKDSPEFSITKVEANIRNDKIKPNFHNYSDFLNYRYAGILRATNHLHQRADIFPVESPLKTYCNLLAAILMSEMIPSINWTGKEIVEILERGYNTMLQVPADTKPKDVTIGNNHFKIEDEVTRCVFYIDERVSEEEVAEKVTELNPLEGERVAGETEEDQQREEDTSAPVKTDSSKDLTPKFTMETQIQSLSSKDVAWIVIESNLYSVALWKQDGFYYVFDPNETTADGKFTRTRLEMIQKTIEEARLQVQMQQIRKRQVATAELLEVEIVEDELKKYAVLEAHLSIMHLPKPSSYPMKLLPKKDDANKGLGASVMVFSNEKVLLTHLLANVSEEYRFCEFTWHSLKIRNELQLREASSNWHDFISHQPKHWILRGSNSQKDDRFNYDNSQDICNSIVSLVIASNIPTKEWKSEMIDVILKYGTRLYSSSLYQVRKSDPRLAMTTRLNIDQMINTFVIGKTNFGIKTSLFELPEQLTKDESDTKKKDEQEVTTAFPTTCNLTKYLTDFFLKHDFGVVLAKKYAVAIFKDKEQHYYLFDPHATGPDGVRNDNGVASVSRYVSSEDLSFAYLSSIEQLGVGPNTFELFKIEIDDNPLYLRKEEVTPTPIKDDGQEKLIDIIKA